MKLRVTLQSMSFMQEQDRAGFQTFTDASNHGFRITLDCVQAPDGPADQPHAPSPQDRMDEGIL
jgi:hypothetical protein